MRDILSYYHRPRSDPRSNLTLAYCLMCEVKWWKKKQLSEYGSGTTNEVSSTPRASTFYQEKRTNHCVCEDIRFISLKQAKQLFGTGVEVIAFVL